MSPSSSVGTVDKVGKTPQRTPLRDRLSINPDDEYAAEYSQVNDSPG